MVCFNLAIDGGHVPDHVPAHEVNVGLVVLDLGPDDEFERIHYQ